MTNVSIFTESSRLNFYQTIRFIGKLYQSHKISNATRTAVFVWFWNTVREPAVLVPVYASYSHIEFTDCAVTYCMPLTIAQNKLSPVGSLSFFGAVFLPYYNLYVTLFLELFHLIFVSLIFLSHISPCQFSLVVILFYICSFYTKQFVLWWLKQFEQIIWDAQM